MLQSPGQTSAIQVADQMQYSVHLFRAAKINSEIKYVANSIVQEAPRYAYPPVTSIHEWQDNVLRQLDQWVEQIPSNIASPASSNHMELICRLRYHGLCMLLLRPSPAISKPTSNALMRCYNSARDSIRVLDELYRRNLLLHSWFTFHGLVLGTLTLLYCVKAEPNVARSVSIDSIMSDISNALSILSATGEHWSGAKKCRDILDDLGKSTIQFLQGSNSTRRHDDLGPGAGTRSSQRSQPAGNSTGRGDSDLSLGLSLSDDFEMNLPSFYSDFLTGQTIDGSFTDAESINVDIMIRDLFQDFIPTTYPFG